MLTGTELGAAIESARVKKGVSKVEMAGALGVKPASVQDWVKHGRIAKARINDLVAYFSDVVGPQHWGFDFASTSQDGTTVVAEIKSPARRTQEREEIPYDRELLRETMLGIAEGIARRHRNLAPEKQADLLVLIYEHYATHPKSESNEVVERLWRLVS